MAFDPAAMMAGLLRGLGVDPDVIMSKMNTLAENVQYVKDALVRIEAQNKVILNKLEKNDERDDTGNRLDHGTGRIAEGIADGDCSIAHFAGRGTDLSGE